MFFKDTIATLMDGTGIYTRSQWAEYLLVSESAISQWTTGRTLPRAENINRILLFLEPYKGLNYVVRYALHDFYILIDRPIEQSLGPQLAESYSRYRTLTHYLTEQLMEAFMVELEGLPGKLHKDIIYTCTALLRATYTALQEGSIAEVERLPQALKLLNEERIQDLLKGLMIQKIDEIDNNQQ